MMPPTLPAQDAPAHRSVSASGVTPLWAVFLFTFLNSIGSAIVYSGIFFIAKEGYGFTGGEQFGLALTYGVMYIPGAIFIGPLLRRLDRSGSLSPRGVLACIMVLMAALCWLPAAADWLMHINADVSAPASRPSWALVLMVAIYSPLSGAMWPMVEAFLAGGRSDHQLRSATGKFNVCWAGTLVLAMPFIGPLIKWDALLAMKLLSAVHLAAGIVLIRTFRPRPGAHAHHSHTPHPPVYTQLLSFLRILLPTAFLFISTLSPYLPGALGALGIETELATTVASTWLFSRVLTFFAMERWHGWHGKWSTVIFGGAVLVAGFSLAVLAPFLHVSQQATIALVVIALAALGIGIGIIYCAALYYAMEVGAAEVDAGGVHETLIGIGYSVGPACGLAAIWVTDSKLVPGTQYEPIMALLVCVIAVVAAGFGLALARRSTRRAAA